MAWELWVASGCGMTAALLFFGYYSARDTRKQLQATEQRSASTWATELRYRAGQPQARYGAVCGRVVCGSPLTVTSTVTESRIEAVVVRKQIVEHRQGFNAKSLTPTTKTVATVVEAVDFDVDDDSGNTVHVPGVKRLAEAGRIPLEVVKETFEAANAGVMTQMFALLGDGQYIKGYQITDEALKVGATIVGVGELSISNGVLTLRPMAGKPFVLTLSDLPTYIASQQSVETVLYYSLAATLAIAAGALAWYYYKRRQEWQRQQQARREWERLEQEAAVQDLAADADAAAAAADLAGRGGEAASANCVVCLANRRSVMLADCRHYCLCLPCARQLVATAEPKCPVCRRAITHRFVPVFNP